MEVSMTDYCYVKKYGRNPFGGSFLENPELMDRYNLSRYGMLISTHGDTGAQRKIKLQILSEFVEIYHFDCEHADYPEPFGYFENEEEKAEFRRRHLLHLDFINYLGSIFAGYHRDIAKGGTLQLPEISTCVVDFNEVICEACLDYASVLLGLQKNVCLHISEEKDIPAKPIIESTITYTGDTVQVPGAEDWKKVRKAPHAIAATYIYPALIEQGLTMYLENSILYQWLDKTEEGLKNGRISLDAKEKVIFTSHRQMRDKGSGRISGNHRKMLQRIWDIGEKTGVLQSGNGMRRVMYGKGEGDDLTLGDILTLEYTEEQIRPEYLTILRLLFGKKNLNLRNTIAHGDQSTIDYLHLGYVAIMYQLLLDIATDDVFFIKGRYAK